MSHAAAEFSSPLPSGRFQGREDFLQLVRDGFACAAQEGWQELVISDAHFHDWPLGERAVVESLQTWAGAGRRFTMLAIDYDAVVRRHPRFVQWRGTWDHIIQCRRASSARISELPSAMWSSSWVLRRLDPERCAGMTGSEPERRVALRESLDEWLLRRSSPGFPATTLGL